MKEPRWFTHFVALAYWDHAPRADFAAVYFEWEVELGGRAAACIANGDVEAWPLRKSPTQSRFADV